MYKGMLSAFFIITLTGCPGPSSQYLIRPEAVSVVGVYIHEPSGLSFPATAGEFVRGSIYMYDGKGQNVSVAYNLSDQSRQIAATIYIYPSPPITSIGSSASVVNSARAHLCNQEFDARKREIVTAHPGAKIVNVAGQPESTDRHLLLFEYEEMFANVRQPLFSDLDLSCYVKDKWTIKYRITYPKAINVEQEVQGLKLSIPQGFNDS